MENSFVFGDKGTFLKEMQFKDKLGVSNHFNQFEILFILVVGFLLRVYDLGSESLWYDEGASLNFAAFEIKKIFFQSENNPPLYYMFLHFWIKLFGDSELSIRFPSALFGTASIWLVFLIGKDLFSRKIAVAGALILALNTYHIFYSQEARVYELTALLTLLSMYYFIKLIFFEKKYSFIGYIFCSSLLLYSHIYGVFIVFVQNLYVLTTYKFHDKRIALCRWGGQQFCLLLLFAPWLHVFWVQTIGVMKHGFWIPEPGLLSLLVSFSTLSGSKYLFILYVIILLMIFLIQWQNIKSFSMFGFFRSLRQSQEKIGINRTNSHYLLLLWLVVPIALPFVISNISTPIFHARYIIVSSPALYLLVGEGLIRFKTRYLRRGLIALFVLISVGSLLTYYLSIKKEQWREVAVFIDCEAMEGDLVLFNSGFCRGRVFNYYSKGQGFDKKAFPERTRDVTNKNIQKLSNSINGRSRVWLILSHSGKKSYLINEEMEKRYFLKRKNNYKGIKLFLYEKKIKKM